MEIPASLVGFLPSVFSSGMETVVRSVQIALGVGAAGLVFLIFWATRDILRRTRSTTLQVLNILMVALLPVVGFGLYLIVRPSRTIEEKEMAGNVQEILSILKIREEKMKNVKSDIKLKSTLIAKQSKETAGAKKPAANDRKISKVTT